MERELGHLMTTLGSSLKLLQDQHEREKIERLFASADGGGGLLEADHGLYQKCLSVVDLLDQLQQILTPPLYTLVDAFFGFVNSKVLLCAVEYNIPNTLAEGPKTIDELVSATVPRLSSGRLSQIMNKLVGIGVFAYNVEDRTYRNNGPSTLVRADHWTQWVHWAKLYPTEFYDMFRFLPEHLKDDASHTAAQLNYSTDLDFYSFLATSELASTFHKTLGAGATAQIPGMLTDYPWYELSCETVMDLGTGSGEFLVRILEAHKDMRGAFMDIPSAIAKLKEACKPNGKYADVAARIDGFHSGDFLTAVPPSSVYTIKWCLHNWSDEQTVTILQHIRRAMVVKPISRLLIIESVLDERSPRTGRPARYGDIIMMATVNGKERDYREWEAVCGMSGWRLHKIWTLRNSIPCCIELRPLI